MATKIEKQMIKEIKEKHKKKWNAPWGKRKCTFNLTEDCLDIDCEDMFRGRMCKECVKQKHKNLHKKRMEERGIGLKERGRKTLTESQKKRNLKARLKLKESAEE